jgi:hypothetical protein
MDFDPSGLQLRHERAAFVGPSRPERVNRDRKLPPIEPQRQFGQAAFRPADVKLRNAQGEAHWGRIRGQRRRLSVWAL